MPNPALQGPTIQKKYEYGPEEKHQRLCCLCRRDSGTAGPLPCLHRLSSKRQFVIPSVTPRPIEAKLGFGPERSPTAVRPRCRAQDFVPSRIGPITSAPSIAACLAVPFGVRIWIKFRAGSTCTRDTDTHRNHILQQQSYELSNQPTLSLMILLLL